jgi:hypothetical protein
MVNKSDIVLIVEEIEFVHTTKGRKDVRCVEEHQFVYIIRINHHVVNVDQS